MPSLVATTSALARKPCVSTHYVRTNFCPSWKTYLQPDRAEIVRHQVFSDLGKKRVVHDYPAGLEVQIVQGLACDQIIIINLAIVNTMISVKICLTDSRGGWW